MMGFRSALWLLGLSVAATPPVPPVEGPYQGDTYYYDSGAGTGSINDGAPQPSDTIYD